MCISCVCLYVCAMGIMSMCKDYVRGKFSVSLVLIISQIRLLSFTCILRRVGVRRKSGVLVPVFLTTNQEKDVLLLP